MPGIRLVVDHKGLAGELGSKDVQMVSVKSVTFLRKGSTVLLALSSGRVIYPTRHASAESALLNFLKGHLGGLCRAASAPRFVHSSVDLSQKLNDSATIGKLTLQPGLAVTPKPMGTSACP